MILRVCVIFRDYAMWYYLSRLFLSEINLLICYYKLPKSNYEKNIADKHYSGLFIKVFSLNLVKLCICCHTIECYYWIWQRISMLFKHRVDFLTDK